MKKIIALMLLLTLSACSVEDPNETGPSDTDKNEDQSQQDRDNEATNLSVQIQTRDGNAVSGATLTINSLQFTSAANGTIDLATLPFGAYVATIQHPDYLPLVFTFANQHSDPQTIELQLKPSSDSLKTLLFAGDTMFGRRYFNPSLITMGNSLPSTSDGLIQPQSAGADAQALVKYMPALFNSVDFASVNLESPILQNPTTVHPSKEFAFFSLPASLVALNDLGIDYVALGNNHVYDYQAQGLSDTIRYVEQAGLSHSGAGNDTESALAPYSLTLGETTIDFISATSITGDQHTITYVASVQKGGAADLTDTTAIRESVNQASNDGRFVVAQLHGGDEYSYAPTAYIANRFDVVSNSGANLMIAHHPHVAQGFGLYNGVPAILGLGNFVFEQNRLETFLGLITIVELETAGEPKIDAIKAYPVYLEDYTPKLVSGDLANALLKRIAEFSSPDVGISLHSGFAEVNFDTPSIVETTQQHVISVAAGEHIIDLRQYAQSSEYVSRIALNQSQAQLTLGRDLLFFGDFEDWDNDTEAGEVSRWLIESDDTYPCLVGKYRGVQGLCLQRTQFDETATRVPFKHTIRTMPITPAPSTAQAYHELTLYGYAKGNNAGRFNADIRILTSEDSLLFSESTPELLPAGTYDWQVFQQDITLPDDSVTLGDENLPARGVQFGLSMTPPTSGESALFLDDVAMISWQRSLSLTNNQWQSGGIHGFEFIKITTPSPTELVLTFSQQ
ncbi:CapA family protein [Pseudoalteromonas sp. McH1-7]|uniref:CapA family protein n=1 Tax=Pseudoalteromonas sp. McH1-7 TaxID=2745574 RepID=UPI0015909C5A|nr:CapA family protein [Pseudoalteromonas sp. McH1-7]NUZ11497.1 CapA family protein [Pseudoalteromonas sp. McH1-7]